MISIYTDGSSKGNPGPGGWAGIILSDDRVVEIGGREEHTTNNRMELVAAIESLKLLTTYSLPCLPAGRLPTTIQINTDSKYVMMGITEWIHNWVKKGWRTAGKKPVLNQDLWQELLSVVEEAESQGLELEWRYVEGHAGHKYNERADEIATNFADLPTLPTGQAGGRQAIPPSLYNGSREKYR